MNNGEILQVITTDNSAENDMLGYLNSSDHEFIGKEEGDEKIFYYIKKTV